MRADDVYDNILCWCKKRRRTPYSLIKEGGVSKSTLYNMKNSGHKPRIDSIQVICDELNITLGQFFADDNTLELTDRDKTILELTKDLNEQKYMRLLAYIEGLHTK